jgi:inorganic triphosphatase YgiF
VAPLLSLETERRLSDVGDSARTRFEMALDRTRFSGPKGETELLEVELESVDGDRSLLEEAAAELRRRFGLPPSGLSKFERALRWARMRNP